MSKKSMLFVVNNFNIGGPQKSLLSLLYKLNYKEFDVSLLSLNGQGSLTKHLPEEVQLLETPHIVKYAILSPENFLRRSLGNIFTKHFPLTFRAISTVISGLVRHNMTQSKQKYWIDVRKMLPKLDNSYDVAIGVSGGHSMMFIADCVTAKKKIGWIRTDYRVLGRNHKIDASYFNEMDEIISVSEICKEIFIDIFPKEKSKVRVMYNVLPFEMYKNIPAETNVIKKDKEHVRLLSISRLDPNKGLDLAIDALEILLNKGYKVKWFVLGDGSYRKKLKEVINSRRLHKHFILLGFHLNTAAFIQESDIIIHPSRFEGKSNVIDEAKYLLKPIVATDYNTVGEQITHDKNGVISNMNSESLALSIEKVLLNNELKKIFKENLIQERYDDRKSLEVFYKLITT